MENVFKYGGIADETATMVFPERGRNSPYDNCGMFRAADEDEQKGWQHTERWYKKYYDNKKGREYRRSLPLLSRIY